MSRLLNEEMMHVSDAIASGSLGQAVFREGGELYILDAPMADPRVAIANEIQWFRHSAREVIDVDPDGLPVPIERVRACLGEEIRFFRGLDGLLVGMDADFSTETRRQAISRANEVLRGDEAIAHRVQQRFLVPANSKDWDAAGGMALARGAEFNAVADCYRAVADGVVDQIADDINAAVLEKAEAGVNAAHTVQAISRSGLAADLIMTETLSDRAAAAGLMFRAKDYPSLRTVSGLAHLLLSMSHRIVARIDQKSQDNVADVPDLGLEAMQDDQDMPEAEPFTAAAERVREIFERRGNEPHEGGVSDLTSIQSATSWIGDRLRAGQLGRAENELIKLMERQARRSRPEDLVKTMTVVADLARKAQHHDWALRVFDQLNLIGEADASARTALAETLRSLGRHDEALASFEETMRRFPDNAVARNAHAETLRSLGRHDDALAGFEETMRRFPRDVVARNAHAETLRSLGRHDEALAGFEETMRRFPDNAVARTAHAETLRSLGRHDEALAGFEETMRRFPDNAVARNACGHLLGQIGKRVRAEALLAPAIERLRTRGDWIALHIRAMIRLRAGEIQAALQDFELGLKNSGFSETKPYFQVGGSLALMADSKARESALQLEELAGQRAMPHGTAVIVKLLHVHALAEAGEIGRARERIGSAEIVDFQDACRKRLALSLRERYALGADAIPSSDRARELDDEIAACEYDLVRPGELDFTVYHAHAA